MVFLKHHSSKTKLSRLGLKRLEKMEHLDRSPWLHIFEMQEKQILAISCKTSVVKKKKKNCNKSQLASKIFTRNIPRPGLVDENSNQSTCFFILLWLILYKYLPMVICYRSILLLVVWCSPVPEGVLLQVNLLNLIFTWEIYDFNTDVFFQNTKGKTGNLHTTLASGWFW
jgi:hypothetical protein